MPDPIVRIATYARVSSDEQRDRHTVLNQRSALSRRLSSEPGLAVFRHYEDDGVSGTVPLEDRPAGGALARDARAGRFSQIWVVRADRLGRDAFELLRIWRVFESIGVALRATDENIDDPFYFDIHAVIAANERRKFLERSAEGMNRAASEGRYTGGIVPLGYTVSGDRGFRRLVPDDSLMWDALSAADVVRRIYHHLAVDGWTCPRIADVFNSLGIPTAYSRDGRGVQRSSHPGPLALRAYPQPRRQSRLQGHPPVRTTIYQAEWTFCHLFFGSPTGLRGCLERRHLYPQAQPRLPPQLLPHLPAPLAHPLRRLRPLLLRYMGQNGASLQVQRLHGPPRPAPGQVHRRLYQGREVGAGGLVGCLPLPYRSPNSRR